MGASSSTNIIKSITESITKVSNETIQKAIVEQNQSLIIRIQDVQGDVIIDGNKFTQIASVDVSALSASLSSSESQNQLDVELAQMAKAVISGLNLLNFSFSTNNIDMLIKSCIDIKNVAIQACMVNIKQNINVDVSNVDGDVKLLNTKTNQVAKSINNCVQEAANSSTTFQDITQKINQSAISETVGLDLNFIAIIIGAMILTGAGGAYAGSKFVFPAILIGSIVTGALWFTWTSSEIISYGFMNSLISESNECEAGVSETEEIGSANLASEKCYNDGKCMAYEYTEGKATFFHQAPAISCVNYFKDPSNKDKTSTLIKPSIYKTATTDPKTDLNDSNNTDPGDGWLNTQDGSVWVKVSGVWFKRTVLSPGDVSWGEGAPTEGTPGSIYIDHTNNSVLKVYKKSAEGWSQTSTIKGPGVNVESSIDSSKTVGFRETYSKTWLLYISIGLLIVGLIGIVVTNRRRSVKS